MKGKLLTIIIILILIGGFGFLIYPVFSDFFAMRSQTRVVEMYHEIVSQIDRTEIDEMIEAATAYNERLISNGDRFIFTDEDFEEYFTYLNVGGRRIMGTLEIGKIGVNLPIYHGTEHDTLLIGAGHFEGSSLPVGGPSTHTIITGHSGLPSATILTHLDRMEVGDVFVLNILGDVLAYQVDQILIVEPYGYNDLRIYNGKDYATLLTCTPYGVNTHRLLVRGERIETEPIIEEHAAMLSDSIRSNQYMFMLVAGLILLVLLTITIILLIHRKRRKKRKLAAIANKPPVPEALTEQVVAESGDAVSEKQGTVSTNKHGGMETGEGNDSGSSESEPIAEPDDMEAKPENKPGNQAEITLDEPVSKTEEPVVETDDVEANMANDRDLIDQLIIKYNSESNEKENNAGSKKKKKGKTSEKATRTTSLENKSSSGMQKTETPGKKNATVSKSPANVDSKAENLESSLQGKDYVRDNKTLSETPTGVVSRIESEGEKPLNQPGSGIVPIKAETRSIQGTDSSVKIAEADSASPASPEEQISDKRSKTESGTENQTLADDFCTEILSSMQQCLDSLRAGHSSVNDEGVLENLKPEEPSALKDKETKTDMQASNDLAALDGLLDEPISSSKKANAETVSESDSSFDAEDRIIAEKSLDTKKATIVKIKRKKTPGGGGNAGKNTGQK